MCFLTINPPDVASTQLIENEFTQQLNQFHIDDDDFDEINLDTDEELMDSDEEDLNNSTTIQSYHATDWMNTYDINMNPSTVTNWSYTVIQYMTIELESYIIDIKNNSYTDVDMGLYGFTSVEIEKGQMSLNLRDEFINWSIYQEPDSVIRNRINQDGHEVEELFESEYMKYLLYSFNLDTQCLLIIYNYATYA